MRVGRYLRKCRRGIAWLLIMACTLPQVWGSEMGTLKVHAEENVEVYSDVVTDAENILSAGSLHSAAIKSDGSLWIWGINDDYQLGDGTRSDKNVPIKVMDNVKAVSLGYFHSAALKEDDSLWMWGNNTYGELGDGTKREKSKPIKVMDNVKTISLGDSYSAAIKTDGSLWMWGSNSSGELGDGTKEDKYKPVKVMDNVKTAFLGEDKSSAIKADGSLWIWGYDAYRTLGMLEAGEGASSRSYEPVKIMDNVKTVSWGTEGGAVIKMDGSLYTWGYSDYGQLGNGTGGTGIYSYEPIKIMEGVSAVSQGMHHCLAVKENGSLWAWGRNDHGQVGNNTTENSSIPIQIMPPESIAVFGSDNPKPPILEPSIEVITKPIIKVLNASGSVL